jgi:hypothetical protein
VHAASLLSFSISKPRLETRTDAGAGLRDGMAFPVLSHSLSASGWTGKLNLSQEGGKGKLRNLGVIFGSHSEASSIHHRNSLLARSKILWPWAEASD